MPHPNRPARTQFLLAATALAATLAPMHAAFAQVAASASVHAHHGKAHAKPVKKLPVAAKKPITALDPALTVAPNTNAQAAATHRYAPIMPVADTQTAESIVVTGSALSTANNTSANPVQIVTAKDIQRTGASTLGDFFQRLPSVGSSGTYNTQTNGSDGASCLDLRNLGQQRVLVLIDGKRTTLNADSNCVDLNSLPVQQVASVEILRDGGSELYGADAVSGVVNIKLRHNMNDANITVRGSITGQGDDKGGILSAYKGWNFDHDRGNITLFGSYMTQGGIRQRNRSWADPVAGTNPTHGSVTYGSSITPSGIFYGNDTGNRYSVANGTLTNYNYKRYDYAARQSLLNQLQDSNLSGDAHYEFNDHFDLYSSVLYAHKTSSTFLAPEPAAGSPVALTVPSDYPGYGAIAGAAEPDGVTAYKRLAEFGDRRSTTALDTVTGKFGLQGEIVHHWMYDLAYTYGSSQSTVQTTGVGNYLNTLREWGLEPSDLGNLADPNTTFTYNPNGCAGYAGCVPSSIFQPMSQAAANYANYTTISHASYLLRDLNLRIHNNHVVSMPWAHGGDLGVAMGMEHRGEQLTNRPDPQVVISNTFGNSVAPTSGGFNVTEGYLEAHLPLLRNAFLAKDLSIDAQGRYSSYNTFGGTKNWKATIDWAPTQDIRFRGTIGTSFRQPNVYETYGGQGLGYDYATDPCAQVGSYAANLQGNVTANCMARGANPANFTQAGTGQIPTISGGNKALHPETGRTYTFGTVITPRWVPGFSTSATFWHYTVAGQISTLGTQYIVDSCYTGVNPGLCNTIRYAGSQIATVSALDQNLGDLIENGIDVDTNYRFHITRMDSISVDNALQRLVKYKQQNVSGGQYYNYLGSIYFQNGSSQPITRDYATVTWQHGPFAISYMMQYISGVLWNDGTQNIGPSGSRRYKTPAMVQNDVTVNYAWKKWNLEAGVQNINAKKPPYIAGGTDNSNAAQYGSFYYGRYFFLQAGVNF